MYIYTARKQNLIEVSAMYIYTAWIPPYRMLTPEELLRVLLTVSSLAGVPDRQNAKKDVQRPMLSTWTKALKKVKCNRMWCHWCL